MKYLILVFVLTISALVMGLSDDHTLVDRKFISEGKCSGVKEQLRGGWKKYWYCCDEDAPVISFPEIAATDTRSSATIVHENFDMLTEGRTNCVYKAKGVL